MRSILDEDSCVYLCPWWVKRVTWKKHSAVAGKPLIAWSIEHAKAVSDWAHHCFSGLTGDCDVATQYGAEVPFIRPDELSSDTNPEWLAWRHALGYLREKEGVLPEVMVSLPADSTEIAVRH